MNSYSEIIEAEGPLFLGNSMTVITKPFNCSAIFRRDENLLGWPCLIVQVVLSMLLIE